MLRSLRRLLADRTAATAVVAAITVPVITATAGAAIDISLLSSDLTQLQMAADSGATAGRQFLDPFQATGQQAVITNAVLYANQNYASSLSAQDVNEGWWDAQAHQFGPPIAGQTTQYDGKYFSNAVQVTTRADHNFIFGQLLGLRSTAISKQSVAYKCSNTNYPLTLVPDDPIPPGQSQKNPQGLPAIWASFSADGHSPDTSYYYNNPKDGTLNPVFKFYVPSDGTDVSFVISGSNGYWLQVDSYCKGTFLVVPDGFDIRSWGGPNVTWTIYRGSTNDSFDIYPDQQDYPMAFPSTIYHDQGAQTISYLTNPTQQIYLTEYPTRDMGFQWWVSTGDPTPARRAIMVQ